MAKRIWLGVSPGFYAGIAGLERGTAYEVSDETYNACPDYWGDAPAEKKNDKKEVTD